MQLQSKIKKAFSVGYNWVNQCLFCKELRKSRKDKIIFVAPTADIINGGVMSIVYMFHLAKSLFPQKDVELAVSAKYQTFTHYSKVRCAEPLINLNYFIKDWIRNGCRIYLNVWEKGSIDLLKYFEKEGLLPHLKNVTLNILNQNQELMPPDSDYMKYTKYFKNVTMTLAHSAIESYQFPYLTIPQMHVGALYEGDTSEIIPYEKKSNLCIISPDPNPVKDSIIAKLESHGIECYHKYPIPYHEFCELQKKAKWAITFGEGWDGYSSGEFLNGGIGFGVFLPAFKREFFDERNLPPFMFYSYEQMEKEIINRIDSLDSRNAFEKINKEMVEKMSAAPDVSTPEKLKSRWTNYYKKIGLID